MTVSHFRYMAEKPLKRKEQRSYKNANGGLSNV